MGIDLFNHLGFSIIDTPVQVVSDITSRWPSLFTGPGKIRQFEHAPIVNRAVKPVSQPCRQLPLSLREEVSDELSRLEVEGIIEKTEYSPWVSNLVPVRKKSGGLRLCIDFRQVNKAIVPTHYPMPTVDELASVFHDSTIFTKLDLLQRYLQIPLSEDSRDLTMFISNQGLYMFLKMPFGLSSAPVLFRRQWQRLFQD